MSTQKYAMQGYKEEHMARAVGRALPISTKKSVEICSFLRNKSVARAKAILNDAMDLKHAIPYRRYNRAMGHRPGPMANGGFPVKACGHILAILESAESNAQFKGLSTANLVVAHICAHKASNQMHYGRLGRKMKRTHIEVVLEEKGKPAKRDGQKQQKQEAAQPQKKEEQKIPEAPKEKKHDKKSEKTEVQK